MNGNQKRAADEPPDLEPRTYKLQRILGQGSYGTVYQAEVQETKDIVAIKSIKPVRGSEGGEPQYTRDGPDREVQILKELNGHPNIVLLKGCFFGAKGEEGGPKMNLVFEFRSDTLHRVIKHHNMRHKNMDVYFVRLYFYQIVRGLAYMHGRGIAHCDLKPQNLLLDGKNHGLRICDFGTAKRLYLGEKRALYICSRYFRAPEIILGSTCYNTSIDLWAAGCILAEMLIRQPLFTGKDGVDQLVEIIKVIGTPTPQDLRAMNPNYPTYEFSPKVIPHTWDKVLSGKPATGEAPPQAVNLVSQLVKFDPSGRLPPLQVLLHAFFDDLRSSDSPQLKIHFTFLAEELLWCTHVEREKLIPVRWRAANEWLKQ